MSVYRKRVYRKPKIIAVDFDGTLCENCWPDIGEPNDKLIDLLAYYHYVGVKLILWTCREGELLDKAVAWCEERGLFFDAVNDNIPETIKEYGNNCRKVSADIYIDDRSVNPLCSEVAITNMKPSGY